MRKPESGGGSPRQVRWRGPQAISSVCPIADAVPPSLFLGIDGGGSGVRALALELEHGTVGSHSERRPADFSSVSSTEVLDAVERAARRALRGQGRAADVAFAGLAGCINEEQQALVAERLVSAGLAKSVAVHHDAYTAWFGATEGDAGVIVMAGTGSSVFAVDEDGREWLVGGYGAVFGDEGSGSDIGREALRAAAAAEDGYGSGMTIRGAVLETLGVRSMREVMPMQRSSEAAWLASLALPVLKLVDDGDQGALSILRSRLARLSDQVVLAVDKFDGAVRPRLFGSGSLFSNSSYLRELRSLVQGRCHGVVLQTSPYDSVQGALLAALAQGGGAISEMSRRGLDLLRAP